MNTSLAGEDIFIQPQHQS